MDKLDKRKIYYLSSGMSGLSNNNRDIFYKVAHLLRKKGYKIYNPCDGDEPENTWKYNLSHDLHIILDLNTDVILLPPWEESKGVDGELYIAVNILGNKVYKWLGEENFEEINFEWIRKELI